MYIYVCMCVYVYIYTYIYTYIYYIYTYIYIYIYIPLLTNKPANMTQRAQAITHLNHQIALGLSRSKI